jgi:hypothetical protein
MLSIWFFVSIVLGTFGILLTGIGTVHAISPPINPANQLAHLNANLWWGAVMVVFAALLFLGDKYAEKRQSKIDMNNS